MFEKIKRKINKKEEKHLTVLDSVVILGAVTILCVTSLIALVIDQGGTSMFEKLFNRNKQTISMVEAVVILGVTLIMCVVLFIPVVVCALTDQEVRKYVKSKNNRKCS